MRQRRPTGETGATGLGGAVALLLVWLLGLYGVEMPPEVAAAVATLLGAVGGFAYLRMRK